MPEESQVSRLHARPVILRRDGTTDAMGVSDGRRQLGDCGKLGRHPLFLRSATRRLLSSWLVSDAGDSGLYFRLTSNYFREKQQLVLTAHSRCWSSKVEL